MDEQPVIPTLPVYQPPRGIPLLNNPKDAKPLMKAIKNHLKRLPKRTKPKRREVKWW